MRHFDRDHEPFTTDVRFEEQATGSGPATPVAGLRVIWAEPDGFHQIDSSGVVSPIGGVVNLSLDDLSNVDVASASGGDFLSYAAATSSWGHAISVVSYINPSTATAEEICNAMISAGMMAASS